MRRSTRSYPPRCHCQRGEAIVVSEGNVSFTRKTRRTTKSRSVRSCGFPVAYSLSRVSTKRGRTLRSRSFCPVAFGHLAAIHFPKAMTWGLGTAAHVLQSRQSVQEMSEILRSIVLEGSHRQRSVAMTPEHGNCSVFAMAGSGHVLAGTPGGIVCGAVGNWTMRSHLGPAESRVKR